MKRGRRRLPHLDDGRALFLTWRLHGSVSAAMLAPPGRLASGEAFLWLDRQLDAARVGPTYLTRPDVARVVVDSIWKGVELGHYELGAFAIMPNHVHLLILPKIEASRLMQGLKGTTARLANRILDRAEEPFWQKESYDHIVRNDEELRRIRNYILRNPVKAGLGEEYLWVSG